MISFDLSLYLILDPDLCSGPQGMIDTARIGAQNGVTMVQLRAPRWKKRLWFETARLLKEMLAPLGVPLIINDQIDVALAIDADGVHVGQEDLPPDVVRRLLGPGKLLGISVANREQLDASDLSGVDYIGAGPIYPTRTKLDAAPALGVDGFAELRRAIHLPTVAIGGIQANLCSPLITAGAQGVAVVSAICGQPDAATATVALRQEIDRAAQRRS
ncbi:MAG: Thiamine-phosphate synthase [Betaproteobacteria bacterium ADurb.Bin341]|nr:MAG: Thiamine-phosphate synthase [Betaproteobacteria bacterium ADurb.Bin341]